MRDLFPKRSDSSELQSPEADTGVPAAAEFTVVVDEVAAGLEEGAPLAFPVSGRAISMLPLK